MQLTLINHPDLSLIDLTNRATSLANRLLFTLDDLTIVEMLSGLQMVLRIGNEGGRRIGLVCWLATWKTV